MMNEAVTKRFLLYFRLMLLVWILIANAIIHVTGLEYSWLIFLSNIMMFTLEGDVKDRFVTVELGGLVGLILTVIALLSITALTPVLGGFFGFLIPLAVVLFILIILHPYAPKVLNNVGFAYLTVACIDTAALATHLPQFFITFIVGSVLFNNSGTEGVSPPTPSNHRLQRGLPGYLILFATHAFEPQRQLKPSKPPSPLVFLLIFTHFTATLGIPLTSTSLKKHSFERNYGLSP